MAQWTDLHNLQDTALIQSFTHMTTLHVPRSWQTSILCVTKFMGMEVLNLQRFSKGAVGLAMFLQLDWQCLQLDWQWFYASAARVCARALILHMHTSTASFIIQQDVVACSIACRRTCVCALAQPTYAHKESRDTARALRAVQERDSRTCHPFPLFRPG